MYWIFAELDLISFGRVVISILLSDCEMLELCNGWFNIADKIEKLGFFSHNIVIIQSYILELLVMVEV